MNRLDVLMASFVGLLVGCCVWVTVTHGLLPLALAAWCWIVVVRLCSLKKEVV
jgi:hypothetical protein